MLSDRTAPPDIHRDGLPWEPWQPPQATSRSVEDLFSDLSTSLSPSFDSAILKNSVTYRIQLHTSSGERAAYLILETFPEKWLNVELAFSDTSVSLCLDKLWVCDDHRKERLSGSLLAAAEFLAKALSARNVMLHPCPYDEGTKGLDRDHLVGFYKRNGYSDVGDGYWAKRLGND